MAGKTALAAGRFLAAAVVEVELVVDEDAAPAACCERQAVEAAARHANTAYRLMDPAMLSRLSLFGSPIGR